MMLRVDEAGMTERFGTERFAARPSSSLDSLKPKTRRERVKFLVAQSGRMFQRGAREERGELIGLSTSSAGSALKGLDR